MKTSGSKTKKAASKRGPGTDWRKLRRISAAGIRKGIAADPDVHATNEDFWKSGKVVMPVPKEIVTMRLSRI